MQYLTYFRGMYGIIRTAFFSILLTFSLNAGSQGLYRQKMNGPYLLLYKLSSEQMDFLAKNPGKIDSQILYTRLVGKLHTDSIIPLFKKPVDDFEVKPFSDNNRYQKCFPRFHVWDIRENGYYLEINISDLYHVQYRIIENPLFNAGVYRIGYETYVFVEDSAGLPVYNAKVTLDTAQCIYDNSVGGYRISGKNIFGLLKIQRGKDFSITHLNGYQDKTNNTAPPRDRYNYAKIRFQGYLVTNKPRYKHWDTLFFKSFLVNAKGKPVKEKLIARLYQNYSGYAKEMVLKPTEKGAYNGYFVVNDSFVLDQEIYITLLDEKRNQIKWQSVMLENYELKDLQFEFRADKQLVTPGAGIKFYATANTANRLPIMDGKLTLKLRINYINYTDGDSVVIPYKKHENWYSISMQTDPSGVTVFEIPDSVFIAMEGGFTATCTLLTADNETRELTVNFSYKTTRDRQEASLESDTLYVKRLYNMKSVKRPMRIKVFSRKDLLTDSVFHTPFQCYLPPNVYMAQIFSGDTLTGTFYRQTMLPEVWGKRTHDSVHIYFRSTKDIPVFYRIYSNNILVAKGNTNNLAWHYADKKKNSYHIQYGILEGSVINPRFYSKSFHLAEKELTIDIQTPTTVYPGQEVPVEISVKDAYGKPVNKVNLAAWAVNNQLEGIVTPDIPYMGLVKTQKALPTQNWPVYGLNNNVYSMLKAWQIDAFQLRKNAVFALVWPQNGFKVLTDTTPHKTTEIDFFAHGKYTQNNIVYVKANDTLIYSGVSSPLPDILRIKPGKYNFSIRTFDHLYQFKNVEITEGKKNFICLQTDTLNSMYPNDTISPGVLTPDELKMIYAKTLLFRYDYFMSDTFIVKVNGNVVKGYPWGSSLFSAFKKVHISTHLFNPGKGDKNKYTTWQDFALFGPVNEGDEIELIWKNSYSHMVHFKPGTTYSFTKNEQVTDENTEWIKASAMIQFFTYKPYNLNEFWWDPYYRDTTKTPPEKIVPYQYMDTKTDLPEFAYSSYYPNNKKNPVQNSTFHFYLDQNYRPQKLWLFEKQDSSWSILESVNTFGNYYSDILMYARRDLRVLAPGKQTQHFRMVLEINDTTWMVKNLDIDSSVHLFLTLHPKEFRKLSKKEYILYDRLAKNLTREELAKWIDTPTVNKGLYIIPLRQKNGSTSIEGTVIGPAIKYPVNNAFIVLEKNGIFVRGAISNREGRFFMDNLQPGIYMLKIKGENYHYWLHYSLEITAGYNHLVQAEMKPYAWFVTNNVAYLPDRDADAVGSYMEPGASMSYSATPQSVMGFNGAVNKASRGKVMQSKAYKRDVSESESRSAVTVTSEKMSYIDGVRDNNVSYDFGKKDDVDFEEKYLDSVYTLGWNFGDQKGEEDRLNKMSGDANARKTRKDFKDHAYWIPNLYTNKQGKTAFTVKYPDNVTSWKTFVPAMDGKRHSGLGEITVRSYKPVVTSLALPLFLTEGDSLTAYGRIMNYTGKNMQGKYTLQYNQNILGKEINFSDMYTDSLHVVGTEPGDTLSVETSFEMANGYRDAEMRKILVNAASVIGGKSVFEEINSDTTLTFTCDSGDLGMEIAVYNHKLALILEMINKVENLPAYDNRSIAAYLNALLMKKSISSNLGIPFTQEKQIREAMGKLKKAQGENGLFGWFKGGKNSFFVSTYIADAMYHAQQMGYENNTWLNAAKQMEKELPHVWGHERLEYLLCLKNMQRKVLYDSFMKALNPATMDKSEKLAWYRLLQLTGKKVPLEEINQMLENTYEGNLKVAGTWNWRYAPITDDAANTSNAWQILFDANAYAERRKSMVEFLTTECSSYGNSWIKGATAMLAEAMRDSSLKKQFMPEIFVNGTRVAVQNLPAIYRLKPGQNLTLKHSGAPVYVAANRTYRTYKPITDSSHFAINVSVPKMQNYHLQAGVPVEMKITVFSKRNQFNSVIEIPIPAGCVFSNKIQSESWVETHREYQNDRVLIFSDELPFGYHTFTIRLLPKFNGTFYTAPARSALMFYPDRAAYTQKQRWVVSR